MPDFSAVEAALAVDDKEQARELLRELMQTNADSAAVWYLAAQAAVNEKQRDFFSEKAAEIASQPISTTPPSAIPSDPPDSAAAAPKAIQLKFASLDKRLVAFAIDQMILSGLGALTLSALSLFMPVDAINADPTVADQWGRLLLIIVTVEFVAYYLLTLTRLQGQTFGKRIMKIRIIKRDGSPLTYRDAFVRCYIGYNLSVLSLGLGFVWAAFDKQQRTLHDILAQTMVIDA